MGVEVVMLVCIPIVMEIEKGLVPPFNLVEYVVY